MPFLVLLAAFFILLAIGVLAIPLSILQRYRAGTARRAARGWILRVNLIGIAISCFIFVLMAAISTAWIPGALTYVLAGLAAGCTLGLFGLLITRWEATPRDLHYTPNRALILSITLLVLARLALGIWRGWSAWQSAGDASWLEESGAAGSMGAGAIVLGYYLVYWAGVRSRWRRWRRAHGW
ncbi:MAG TPA: DUF1453 domain-containing protein [Thermoanaerobaculia bacterium]|nr:DUF1453 domain-containing protein [Thermoanaerobaculia bacterium]